MKSIAIRLKEIRKAKGWTQDDLAEAAGMNYYFIRAVFAVFSCLLLSTFLSI